MVNGVILLGAEQLGVAHRRGLPRRLHYAYAGADPDPWGGGVRRSAPGSGGAAVLAAMP